MTIAGSGHAALAPDEVILDGSLGIAFLESLRADVAAFAGLDARAPMRRDLLRKMTTAEARADDV